MTEPLIVDPDRLNSASAILGAAAGGIPAVPPKLSVPGSDPLSMAIAKGSLSIEKPLDALPDIKRDATSTARNIGTAGQMYAKADQELAARVERNTFETGGGAPKLIGNAADAAVAKGREPFSWNPTPTDVATGAAGGVAGAAHDYATGKASKLVTPSDRLLNWTQDLKVKGVEVPGFSRAGGLLGVITAIPGGIIDYSEAKASGASTVTAVGQAVTREGAGTATGLIAATLASAGGEAATVGILSAIAGDAAAGAALGSVIPGAGTAVGLVAGLVVGGTAAFFASKGVERLWDVAG